MREAEAHRAYYRQFTVKRRFGESVEEANDRRNCTRTMYRQKAS